MVVLPIPGGPEIKQALELTLGKSDQLYPHFGITYFFLPFKHISSQSINHSSKLKIAPLFPTISFISFGSYLSTQS